MVCVTREQVGQSVLDQQAPTLECPAADPSIDGRGRDLDQHTLLDERHEQVRARSDVGIALGMREDGQEALIQEGEEQELAVELSSRDFMLALNQQQVSEISVLGQVRERSSWSSHVRWYPIDTANDAAVDITFVVPEEYTAVTGGRLIGVESRAGKREFHYASDIRKPRLLPFGFAVARLALAFFATFADFFDALPAIVLTPIRRRLARCATSRHTAVRTCTHR